MKFQVQIQIFGNYCYTAPV